jgi:hypothetical protein
MSKGAKTKSKKQVGFLLSSGSPLTDKQKSKLKGELHSGAVKVKGGKKKATKKRKYDNVKRATKAYFK